MKNIIKNDNVKKFLGTFLGFYHSYNKELCLFQWKLFEN